MAKKIKLELNSIDNLQLFIQEIADEAFRTYNQIEKEINKITTSTDLSNALIGEKASYAKIIHDYLTDKDRAHKARQDVAKIMLEVLKFKGDEKSAIDSINKQVNNGELNLSELRKIADTMHKENSDDDKKYQIKK